MASGPLSRDAQRKLVQGWHEAGLALARLRRAELSRQSAEESRQAAFEMLQVGGMLGPDPKREVSSGLVEMQRLFARGHDRRRR